jgi:REP element-mobilizing transposase RayT
MPDHVHLLLSPMKEREQSLSDFMRSWKSCVVLRLRQIGMESKVWQREFHDRLLRSDEKLEEKWEYVRQNPVRAGLCREPEEYPFSGTTEEIVQKLTEPKV